MTLKTQQEKLSKIKHRKKKKTEINISKMWDNLQVVEEPGNGEWDKKYILKNIAYCLKPVIKKILKQSIREG